MKKLILAFSCVLLLMSCGDDKSEREFIIFGHIYGFCFGEQCIEIFKLTDDALYEDRKDEYQASEFDFERLDDSTFDEVKDLKAFFPEELLDDDRTVIGCPDCYDQGGYYIEVEENGIKRSWFIDTNKADVPEYLHDFLDRISDKIELINN